MRRERIHLDPTDARVYIDLYVTDDSVTRPAMLVIPGGGYEMVCHDREGEPIALAFVERGFNAFVLNYRTDGDRYPSQLIDASRAVVYIRDNASTLYCDPDRVYAVGFSAGGHLAGSLAILNADEEVLSTLGIEKGWNRPNAAILAYPVVSAMLQTHVGSFRNLMGGEPHELTGEERSRVSLECNVTQDSAPLFIWHTAEDEMVPTNGSLALASKYISLGLNVMLHLYPYGPHGVALGTAVTEAGNPAWIQPLAEIWVDSAVKWIDTLK